MKLTKLKNQYHNKSVIKINRISMEEKNFNLTQLEFDTLANALRMGSEELFEKIFVSHFEDCKKYIMNRYSVSSELAYDITMDTLIDFRKLIIHEKVSYGNLRYLFTKIATQNWIRFSKNQHRIDMSLFYEINESDNKEHLYDALSNAWETLDKKNKEILEAHFYNKTPLVKIAKMLGISDSNMRKKKQRGLEKLRSILFNELQIKRN